MMVVMALRNEMVCEREGAPSPPMDGYWRLFLALFGGILGPGNG